MKAYRHPEGYRYYMSSHTENGKRIRPTVSEHQLLFLMHECDDSECDCRCGDDCPCSGRGACPYKIFSNGKWQIHHGRNGGKFPGVPDKWANWGDNIIMYEDEYHGHVTYAQRNGGGAGEKVPTDFTE